MEIPSSVCLSSNPADSQCAPKDPTGEILILFLSKEGLVFPGMENKAGGPDSAIFLPKS